MMQSRTGLQPVIQYTIYFFVSSTLAGVLTGSAGFVTGVAGVAGVFAGSVGLVAGGVVGGTTAGVAPGIVGGGVEVPPIIRLRSSPEYVPGPNERD